MLLIFMAPIVHPVLLCPWESIVVPTKLPAKKSWSVWQRVLMTSREFIEKGPLYTRFSFMDFHPPDSIMRLCASKECKTETTWTMLRGFNPIENRDSRTGPGTDTGLREVAYICGICHARITVFYELLDWKQISTGGGIAPPQSAYTAVRKVGQTPPQEIDIPPELNTRLGTASGHDKKALVCRAQNYGIGAMAYLRRVVDEKTDELIDVMVALSQASGVGTAEIGKLQDAKAQVRYEDKLKVAAELIPEALKPSGINPLGQLYKHTSVGLHGKTDDECIRIFDDLQTDFEYVFRNLHLQAEKQRQYAIRIQERATRPTKSN